MRITSSGPFVGLLALALLGTSHANAAAALAVERVFVRSVVMEGLESGVLPEHEALALEVELAESGPDRVAADGDRPGKRVPLWALGGRDGRWLRRSALRRVLERVADAYRERGLYGARINIDRGSLLAIDSEEGSGLLVLRVEEPSRGELGLVPGGVDGVRVNLLSLRLRGDVPDLISEAELLALDVPLSWRGDGYGAPLPGQTLHEVPLATLLRAAGPALYGSAVREIVRRIAGEYRDRGLRAARLEVGSGVLERLREPGSDGVLVLDVTRW